MAGLRMRVARAVLATALVACVEVPDNVRAHFAEARFDEASNFRKGRHGTAPPNDDAPPAEKAASSVSDAGAPLAPTLAVPVVAADGGAS